MKVQPANCHGRGYWLKKRRRRTFQSSSDVRQFPMTTQGDVFETACLTPLLVLFKALFFLFV